MKIGLVRRGFSASGGAEAYLLRFADAAVAAGHEMILFSGADWPTDSWRHEFVRVSNGESPLDFANALQSLSPKDQCDVLFSLERVWECDVYRAGDGVHASWLERRQAFETSYKSWFRGLQSKHREILKLERVLFEGGAKQIIANSQMVKDEIVRYYDKPAHRIHVVHNGLPPANHNATRPNETREQCGLNEDDYAVLFVGSGWERKGLNDAIEAVNALPAPATLLVVGKGKGNKLTTSQHTHLLGTKTSAQLKELLATADAFILPTYYEPFSNACLEALAAGVPVITTTANGFAEIIEPGIDGEIVSPGDVAALSAALEKWRGRLRDGTLRTRLKAKGALHTIEQNFARTLEVLLK